MGCRTRPPWRPLPSLVVFWLAAACGCGGDSNARAGAGSESAVTSSDAGVVDVRQELLPELQAIRATIGEGHYGNTRSQVFHYLKREGREGNRYQGHFVLGDTYLQEHRYELARGHFEQSLEIAPGFLASRKHLGYCAYYMGELDQARDAFERYLTDEPGDGEAHGALGLALLDADRLDEAEAHLRRSAEIARERRKAGTIGPRALARALTRQGDLHTRRGELERARRTFEEALDLWPEHYEVQYKLQRTLVRLGDLEAAGRVVQDGAGAPHDEARKAALR